MRSSQAGSRRWITVAIVFLLWMLSLVLGLYAIYSLQETVITLYAMSGGRDQSVAGLLRWVSVGFGAILWIGIMIAGGEYHMKNAGARKSWKIFAWTFGIEVIIILVGLLVQ
jgi:hypothetical protein